MVGFKRVRATTRIVLAPQVHLLIFKIDECYKQFKIRVSKPFQDGIKVSLKKTFKSTKIEQTW
jgi:hypothetical protein